jgi:hypothetical protein
MDHLKTLKLVNFALGAYTAFWAIAVFVMFVIPGLWAWWDGQEGAWMFALFGLLFVVALGAVGAVHVVVGYLVGSGRGRVAQTCLAVTQIMSFPVGTLYGLYALWVCWSDAKSGRRFDATIKPPIT